MPWFLHLYGGIHHSTYCVGSWRDQEVIHRKCLAKRLLWASWAVLRGKNPSASAGETHEMRVRPLSQEDPLEEGMATHSSILACRVLDRGAWWATVHGVAKSWTRLKRLSSSSCSGNGSCGLRSPAYARPLNPPPPPGPTDCSVHTCL